MSFAVVCKSCQARFLLNDDLLRRKVAGKVVTVRCRQCHATIEVDGSNVDPKTLPENEQLAPKPAPLGTRPMAVKPAPSPPRPPKASTLMGIGGPPRPAEASELVALSPGFLSVSAAPAGARAFPEPPPPPGIVEELNSGDWEITETPPLAKTDTGPVSVDDFIEELPPSLPPPEEEIPSSSGTPSLKALTHHDEQGPRARSDDFLANMSAAMNGGFMGPVGGAPTIDVSTLGAPEPAASAPSIDISDFDLPVGGSKTLPLFALGDTSDTAATPALPRGAPPRRAPMPSPAEGSLSPASLDRPAPGSERAESVRERKYVVAPATQSVPPAARQRRSGLAAPVLLVLAAAAGFLIWKRGAAPVDGPSAHDELPAGHAPEMPVALPAIASEPAQPSAQPAAAAPTAADDVTFETTPTKPLPVAAAHDKPAETAPDKPSSSAPDKPTGSEPKPEPTAPIAKDEPKAPAPVEPSEPSGPFDRAAAAAALTSSAAQASSCRKDGDPSGVASVVITFAPSGRVTSANISGPPFAGTATGGCIANALRKAHIPPFEGDRVTVSKTIVVQ